MEGVGEPPPINTPVTVVDGTFYSSQLSKILFSIPKVPLCFLSVLVQVLRLLWCFFLTNGTLHE
jgi:hypothetical protein